LLQSEGWLIQEATGRLRRAADLLVAHAADRGDLLLKLGRLRFECGEGIDVGVDGVFDAARRVPVDPPRGCCLLWGTGRNRGGRFEDQLVVRRFRPWDA